MREALLAARVVLLAGPTALAFFSGGFFDGPRVVAGIAAWTLVAVAAIALPAPLPHSLPARVALAALAGLAGWTALSVTWAALGGPAYDDVQRVALYLGAALAATALLAERGAARAAEPALAAGALAIVLYGLSERLLPGLIELTRSQTAEGRLDQPLTYWNAMGTAAAFGLVLCGSLAGDATRPPALRAAAAAGAAPLGLGLYVTFSRAGLLAFAAGLVVLAALRPERGQLWAAGVVLAAAFLAAVAGAPLPGVTGLDGSDGRRALEGAIALAALAALAAGAAVALVALVRAQASGRLAAGRLRLPRRTPAIAATVVALLLAGFAIAAAVQESAAPRGPTAARFGSVESHRYAYWRVAVNTLADHPLRGLGTGSFRVAWLRDRPFEDSAHDAHSLFAETAAELGLVGLLLVGAVLGGVAGAARRALRADPALAAGAIAGVVTWATHAALDWDWEMPAVTLPAIVLAGLLLAAGERPRGETAA